MMPRRYRGGSLEDRALEVLEGLPVNEWVVPMQVGGSDASHHSGTLDLQGRRKRRAGHTRPSYLYQINPDGMAMLRTLKAQRRPCLETAEDT